jgi:hypothetical protein
MLAAASRAVAGAVDGHYLSVEPPETGVAERFLQAMRR